METLLPTPLIRKRKGNVQLIGNGRGFSYDELSKAGMSLDVAKKTGLRIDLRRRTTNEENVERLKEWFKKMDRTKLKKMRNKPKRKTITSGNKQRGRASRGLTSAGKKGRGLRKSRGLRARAARG